MWPFTKKSAVSINQVIERLEAIYASRSGVSVTPENCMRSPTMQAIVTAVSRRISVSPLRVMQKRVIDGRTFKNELPEHPLSRLFATPNNWQTRVTFWLDATSQLLRYGNAYAFKSAGRSRTIRRLLPLHAGDTRGKFDDRNMVVYSSKLPGDTGAPREFRADQVVHMRGAARDFLNGDSPISDIREAIALEIAAERYGASFFGNGAMALMIFELMDGFADFKTKEEKSEFVASVRKALSGDAAFSGMVLPKGMKLADNAPDADQSKTQLVESRQYQRTVIAGAYGVPPHLVGDLLRATFNNVEQQDKDFTQAVILPYARTIETALERDCLTPADRQDGVIIRFNLDAIQRADFKTRQEGLQIQRLNGVISANEWRERENLNPIDDEQGGEDYWMPANYQLPAEAAADNQDADAGAGDSDADTRTV